MAHPYNLSEMTTRELMRWLGQTRKFGGGFDPTNCGGAGAWVTAEEIKAVLATREHIPNKREGQVLRRAKAKGRKGERRSGMRK